MSIKVKKHIAERFMDWFPHHTNLYLEGTEDVDWKEASKLREELFHQLVSFFEGYKEEVVNEALGNLEKKLDDRLRDLDAEFGPEGFTSDLVVDEIADELNRFR